MPKLRLVQKDELTSRLNWDMCVNLIGVKKPAVTWGKHWRVDVELENGYTAREYDFTVTGDPRDVCQKRLKSMHSLFHAFDGADFVGNPQYIHDPDVVLPIMGHKITLANEDAKYLLYHADRKDISIQCVLKGKGYLEFGEGQNTKFDIKPLPIKDDEEFTGGYIIPLECQVKRPDTWAKPRPKKAF
jgi:hypothetical protein